MDSQVESGVDRQVRQLQHDLVRDQGTVSSLLRRVVLLAHAKGDRAFESWAQCELEGAGWDDDFPSYRIVHGRTQGFNPVRGWVPVQAEDGRLTALLTQRKLETSVPEIETLLDGEKADQGFNVPVPPEGENALNGLCNLGFPTHFRFVFGRGGLDRILVAVKNRLLSWTMQFSLATEENMPFREMMNETFSIVRDGAVAGTVQGRIDPDGGTSTTFDTQFSIEEGDLLERVLPGGKSEQFRVIEPGYHARFEDIPARYHSRIERVSKFPKLSETPASVTYNLHGSNARINHNSIDNSTNTVQNADLVWNELRNAIQNVPEIDRPQVSAAAAAMEQAHGTPTFVDRYKDFMATAANHVAVLGPIVAKLATLF